MEKKMITSKHTAYIDYIAIEMSVTTTQKYTPHQGWRSNLIGQALFVNMFPTGMV